MVEVISADPDDKGQCDRDHQRCHSERGAAGVIGLLKGVYSEHNRPIES